jgi:hypothetical protein
LTKGRKPPIRLMESKTLLKGMFPPRYRVSNCEGYKQGSAWLRMKKLLRQMVYNAKREPDIG